jgi:hypothetical protein
MKKLPLLLFLCLLPIILFPLAHYLAVAPFGSELWLWLIGLLSLPILITALGIPILIICLFFRGIRHMAIVGLIFCIGFSSSTFVGLKIGQQIRMTAFHRLAERSETLIEAITTYQKENGKPPSQLEDLIPRFFNSVPKTGIAAYPNYEYHSDEETRKNYHGNTWVLLVFTPSGGINFDMFMYFPNQNYPEKGYGGFIERISDWAYVHE